LTTFMYPSLVVLPSMEGNFQITSMAAIKRLKRFDPAPWGVPEIIPINEVVRIWGRPWRVTQTSLQGKIQLGVFACEDILVCAGQTVDLFPYCGSVYSRGSWQILVRHLPSMAEYSLSVDSGSDLHSERRYVDGDPVRSSNIAGYVNSSYGFRSSRPHSNVAWQVRHGRPMGSPYISGDLNPVMHVMTVAKHSITAGDELFAAYNPSMGREV
jgi:hypothetical protein